MEDCRYCIDFKSSQRLREAKACHYCCVGLEAVVRELVAAENGMLAGTLPLRPGPLNLLNPLLPPAFIFREIEKTHAIAVGVGTPGCNTSLYHSSGFSYYSRSM